MKNIVKKTLQKYIDADFSLEKPKDITHGHFSTPVAFSLAKTLRKSPMIIAKELASSINEEIFESVESVKGYINIKLSVKFLDEYCVNILNNPEDFAKDNLDESILLEYVSANPTGPLHIGHARGAVYGDTLYRVAKHLGCKIQSEYYVNDAGNQMLLLGTSIILSAKEHILKENVLYPESYYRGEYIDNLALKSEQEFGKAIFVDDNISKLSLWAKDRVIDLIKSNLSVLGISFDNWISEKELFKNWDETFNILKKSGAIYEKDSKFWLATEAKGDEKDRVVVRENGIPTYLAGDIIYHNNKYARKFDKYINIWGADHHGYITRVKASIDYLGQDSNKLEVILAQMVALLKDGEPFKMSKRSGNVILLSDVVEEIGSDALRFIFLTKRCDTHLEFDVETLKKQDSSNPIFYVNYAHARIQQVFKKAEINYLDVKDISLEGINEDAKSLLFLALNLKEILNTSFSSGELQKITEYVKNLSAGLHKFYNANKVVGSDNEKQLLKIMSMVGISIKTTLKLMGIEAKNRM